MTRFVGKFYIYWTMRECYEEEMWVWCFPNHKCQKTCQITSQRQVICKEFWHEWFGKPHTHISDLTVFTLLKTTNMKILQIWWKNLRNCSKMMVFFMFTLFKVAETHVHTLQSDSKTHVHTHWQFFFWKICQIVIKYEYDFYWHFVKCEHDKLFYIFATIVVFYNGYWICGQSLNNQMFFLN